MPAPRPPLGAVDVGPPPPARSGPRGRRASEIGVVVALSVILGALSIPLGAAGGQLSLDMIPTLALARLRGPGQAALAGATYGLIHLLQEPILLHPFQGLLDYPVAFASLSLAGALPGRSLTASALATSAGCLARYLIHALSGGIFLRLFLPGGVPGSPWLYSLAYNATYMGPSSLAALLLVPPLVRRLARTRP